MRNAYTSPVVAVLLGIAMLSSAALAAKANAPAPNQQSPPAIAKDVALLDGGQFVGRVVDWQGQPLAHRRVVVRQRGEVVAQAESADNGTFVIQGLRGGGYEIGAGATIQFVRLWSPGTAPPAATAALQLVYRAEIVRGQQSNPLPVWIERSPINGTYVKTVVAVGVIGGLSYWILDYNDPGS